MSPTDFPAYILEDRLATHEEQIAEKNEVIRNLYKEIGEFYRLLKRGVTDSKTWRSEVPSYISFLEEHYPGVAHP